MRVRWVNFGFGIVLLGTTDEVGVGDFWNIELVGGVFGIRTEVLKFLFWVLVDVG